MIEIENFRRKLNHSSWKHPKIPGPIQMIHFLPIKSLSEIHRSDQNNNDSKPNEKMSCREMSENDNCIWHLICQNDMSNYEKVWLISLSIPIKYELYGKFVLFPMCFIAFGRSAKLKFTKILVNRLRSIITAIFIYHRPKRPRCLRRIVLCIQPILTWRKFPRRG